MKTRIVAGAHIAVSLIGLGAVVWWAMGQDPPELPRTRNDVLALVGGLGLYALAMLARAERWHRIVERAAIPAERGDTYRLTAVGYMGNNVLPARSGDLMRAFLLAPIAGARRREVLGTIVAERLLDALALGLVFAAVALVFVRDAALPNTTVLLLVAAGAVAVGVIGLATLLWARRTGALGRARELLRPLAAPSRNLASGHGGTLLALSIVVWLLEASVYLAVARAVNLDFGFGGALYVMAIANLFALIPAAPGYVGTYDAGVLFAVHSLGEEGSAAVAYLVMLRFLLFVPVTLVGLGFLMTRYGGWSRLRTARVETPA
jgi:uncharacterized membrane protein YbhN (UPF0104 family)